MFEFTPTVLVPDDAIPQRVGRYRILERIGKGAMGVVYAAHDDMTGRDVAIKVMMADLEFDADIRARFFREAQIAAKLLHRNIVTVFDMGEEDGRLFIVMQLLQGLTLSEHVKQNAPSLEDRLDLMIQIGEGLSAASAAGVFHRDVKPGNLFVERDGNLKILDFGIARLADSTMTATGAIVGTPDYMSPEQAQGVTVDERSDIFSAAAVFYYILTGRKPFQAPDIPAVLHKVLVEDPLPLRDTEAPLPLTRIVERGLAKDPARRYQHFRDLLVDLVRFGRSYAAETRSLASEGWAGYEDIRTALIEQAQCESTLGVHASAGRDAFEDALVAAHPALRGRGIIALKTLPLQRHVVEAILADLNGLHDATSDRLNLLRAACAHMTAAAAEERDGRVQRALKEFEQAARLVPEASAAAAAVERCRRAADEQHRLEGTVRALLSDARDQRRAGRPSAALAQAERALALLPSSVEAEQVATEARADLALRAADDRRRLDEHAERVKRAVAGMKLPEAERELQVAVAAGLHGPGLESIAADVGALRARIAAADALAAAAAEVITTARASFAAGDCEGAIDTLKRFAAAHAGERSVTDEIAQLKAEGARIAERQRIEREAAALAAAAATAWARQDAGEALRLAGAALALVPAQDNARQIAEAAAVRVREQADRAATLALVTACLHRGWAALDRERFDRAIKEAERAALVDPASLEPGALKAAVEQRRDALARERASRRAAAQRARAARPAVATARVALKAGDAARARWAAENALALDPENVEARQLLADAGSLEREQEDDTVDLLAPTVSTEDTAVIRFGIEGRLRAAARAGASLVRAGFGAARESAARVLARLRSQTGQTTTEWLMIAGLLSAMAIAAGRYVPGLLRDVVVAIARDIRTIAP